MRQSLVAKIAMMGVAAVATVGLASAGEIKEERRQFDQRELSVYDPAGGVRIEAGEGPFITINVARGGKDAERIKLKSDFVDDVASLAVVFPGDAIVYPAAGVPSTDVFVNGEGKFGPEIAGRRMTIATQGEGLEAWADMIVRVPAGRRLTLTLGVGKLAVSNVDGALRLQTIAGAVEAEGAKGSLWVRGGAASVAVKQANAAVDVATESGAIQIVAPAGRKLSAKSATGAVTIALDAKAGAVLDARSEDGKVTSKLDVPVKDGRRAAGKVGEGAAKVSVETESGAISIIGA